MNESNLISKIKAYFKNLPLRIYIIAPVALLFAIAMVVSAYLSYQTSSKLIYNLLDSHALVISKSVSTQLDDFFSKAIQNTQINKNLIETDALDAHNSTDLATHFLAQIQNTPYMSYVSIGFPNGEYIGASRQVATGEINLITALKAEGLTLNRFQVAEGNVKGQLIEKGVPFDSTSRIWYKTALNYGRLHWYPVYKYAAQDTLGLGISTPVYASADHHLLGVLTTDLALNRISEFLQTFQVDNGGIIFISEPSGSLVATSAKQVVYFKEANNYKRYSISNFPDSRIREAQKLINKGQNGVSGKLFKTAQGQYQFNYKIYRDQLGQELIIGVILSVDTFTHVYMTELYNRIFFGVVFLTLMGILLVFILQQIVLPPIRRLVKAHKLIENGDFTARVPVSNIREISVLTSGFNETADALGKSATIEKAYMAHEKMAALGGLVSGITHEINTPLGMAITISSFIEKNHRELTTLIGEGKISKSKFVTQSEEMTEDMVILQTHLSRAAELIRSFKAIAVGQSSEIEVRFNVKELIGNVLTSLRHEYKRKNHQFVIECDESLTINSYPGAMTQILTNLIMNSLIHGFGDQQNGEIRIKVIHENHHLILIYEDNGNGMCLETKEKIFVPFFTTNRENGGTGIGMNIIHNIVSEQLHGTISVESELGQGVHFEVSFAENVTP